MPNALDSIGPTPRNALLGTLADYLSKANAFAQQPDRTMPMGKSNPVLALLANGVGLPDVAATADRLSYGLPVTQGQGQAMQMLPETRNALMAVLPFVAKNPVAAGKAALGLAGGGADAGMAAERAMFIGPNAKTWDAAAAAKAAAMDAAGSDARAVWKEAGTFKGADGMWRQEIDDSGSMFRGFGATDSQPVGQAIHHPGAIKAYPEMADMRAQSVPGTGGSFSGEMGYAPSSPTVNLGWDNGQNTHSTALHELQHAVQGREGWALGGSPKSMADLLSQRAQLKAKFDAAVEQSLTAIDPIAKANAQQERQFYGLALGKLPRVDSAQDAYRKLAGEAEARATQARMNMNQQQRRATFPFDSYDVPVNELIVRK